jgi:hypothetical protein
MTREQRRRRRKIFALGLLALAVAGVCTVLVIWAR